MTLPPDLHKLLTGNQFLSGGLMLGALAGLVAYGRGLFLGFLGVLRRRLIAELEVRDYETVTWLGVWLAHSAYGRRCRRLKTFTWGGSVTETEPDRPEGPTVFFEPGYGAHIFRHHGRWIYVERCREDEKAKIVGGYARDFFRIRVPGSRSVAVSLIEEAKLFSREALGKRHAAYLADGSGDWDRLAVGTPRSMDSVILDAGIAESIEADARRFLKSRDWYAARGIPWRHTVELWGPPGTGKTSVARALACELGLPLYVLDLTSKEFADRDLVLSLSRIPVGAVVLAEDLDVQLDATASILTLSGLLNALDGSLAAEGRLLFITTNCPDRLDAAISRPGRVNRRYHLDLASHDQARRIFLRFFPGAAVQAEAFGSALPDRAISPAAIQEYLITHSDSAEGALERIADLARTRLRAVVRGAAEEKATA